MAATDRLSSGSAQDAPSAIEFEQLAASFVQSPHRVFAIEHGGRKFWVKRISKNLPNPLAAAIYHTARTLAGKSTSAQADHEIASLMALKRQGFVTPDIVFRNSDYFVLTDIGPSLEAVITLATGNPDERLRTARLAGQGLRALHDAGRWHGAARIHNLTMAGPDQIGFIDLENTVDTWLPFFLRKCWDLWQLGHSAAFFEPHVPMAETALRAYGAGPVRKTLYALAVLFFGTYAALYPFRNTGKREIRQTHACMRAIYRAPRMQPDSD